MQAIDEDIADSYLREFMNKKAFVRLTFLPGTYFIFEKGII